MMTRRLLVSSLGAAGLGGAWVRYLEPHWFELTHTQVRLAGVRHTRILHIADIHTSDGMAAEDLERGLKMGLAQRPDVICLTGDFVSSTTGFDEPGLRRMLRRIADTAPAFAVLGNHDGGRWLARFGGEPSIHKLSDLVQSAGVHLLHNRSARFGSMRLVGLADLWAGGFDPHAAFAGVDPAERAIVLCHNPDGKDRLRAMPWTLMLSGHTHGGQARVPGIRPDWAPVSDKRFVSGLHAWDERQLFITRGLGSPKHVRALCRPEVSILEIASG
ncbi:MAG: phosphodiesterase YaeI [Bryobacterales bacterium]|nr:phosphodiesterase YaeI [Bryobacterales bacterium]